MTRQIKFRVWNNYTNAWMYQFAQDICKSFGVPSPTLKVKPPFIYQQFIGLIDKNGKEIYEGDIISLFDETEETYIIKYDEEDARFVLLAKGGYGDWFRQKDRKIIGNIFETPELL